MRTPGIQDVLAGLAVTGLVLVPPLRALLGLPGVTYAVFIGLLIALASVRLLRPRLLLFDRAMLLYLGLVLSLAGILLFSASWTIAREQHVIDAVLIAGLLASVVSASLVANVHTASVVEWAIPVAGLALGAIVFIQYLTAGSLFGYDVGLIEYYLTISTPLALGAVLGLTRAATRPPRLLAGAVGLFSMAALGLSLSRGSLLAAMLITAIFSMLAIYSGPISRDRLDTLLKSALQRMAAGALVLAALGGVSGQPFR
jgi:hypothetical protein